MKNKTKRNICRNSALNLTFMLGWAFLLLVIFLLNACSGLHQINDFIDKNIRFAEAQEELQVTKIEESGKILNPRTVENGKVKYVSYTD